MAAESSDFSDFQTRKNNFVTNQTCWACGAKQFKSDLATQEWRNNTYLKLESLWFPDFKRNKGCSSFVRISLGSDLTFFTSLFKELKVWNQTKYIKSLLFYWMWNLPMQKCWSLNYKSHEQFGSLQQFTRNKDLFCLNERTIVHLFVS